MLRGNILIRCWSVHCECQVGHYRSLLRRNIRKGCWSVRCERLLLGTPSYESYEGTFAKDDGLFDANVCFHGTPSYESYEGTFAKDVGLFDANVCFHGVPP